MSFWNLFGGSVVDGVAEVAKEWIETDKESAEAKAIMVKTLDPSGKMRRQLSVDVTQMYKVYIYLALFLILFQSSGYGGEYVASAINNIKDLFLPITALFGSIVTASFGVNAMNVHKELKEQISTVGELK